MSLFSLQPLGQTGSARAADYPGPYRCVTPSVNHAQFFGPLP
jgi:hypothetical protein